MKTKVVVQQLVDMTWREMAVVAALAKMLQDDMAKLAGIATKAATTPAGFMGDHVGKTVWGYKKRILVLSHDIMEAINAAADNNPADKVTNGTVKAPGDARGTKA